MFDNYHNSGAEILGELQQAISHNEEKAMLRKSMNYFRVGIPLFHVFDLSLWLIAPGTFNFLLIS